MRNFGRMGAAFGWRSVNAGDPTRITPGNVDDFLTSFGLSQSGTGTAWGESDNDATPLYEVADGKVPLLSETVCSRKWFGVYVPPAATNLLLHDNNLTDDAWVLDGIEIEIGPPTLDGKSYVPPVDSSDFFRDNLALVSLDLRHWDTSSLENVTAFARNCTNLTELDASNWDTSSLSSANNFARGCTNLTALDVSNWNTSILSGANSFARGCASLTELDVSNWDTSSLSTASAFVTGCTSLTALDLSNWDTSVLSNVASFASGCTSLTTVTVTGGTGSPFSDSPCTNYGFAFSNTNLSQSSIDDILVAIEAAGTSSGTFDQSGGSAPSATGEAAIDALRGRGWTVAVTGGY